MIPATNLGSEPFATSGRALNSRAARRRPRSTAFTTSDMVKPSRTRQLGGEPDFDVANALVLIVQAEFVGDSLDRLRIVHDRGGVEEPFEILGEVLVGVLEHQCPQPFHGGGRQLHLPLPRQFDQGGDPQRTVQVDVQIGLGESLNDVRREFGHFSFLSLVPKRPYCLPLAHGSATGLAKSIVKPSMIRRLGPALLALALVAADLVRPSVALRSSALSDRTCPARGLRRLARPPARATGPGGALGVARPPASVRSPLPPPPAFARRRWISLLRLRALPDCRSGSEPGQ